MLPEDVHPHDGLVEVRVRTLHNVVIQVLLITKNVHALEDEVEQCLQVLRTRTGDENVRVSVCKCGGDGETESSGFASTSGGGEGDCRGKSLLRNRVDEGQYGLGLVDRLGEFNQVSDRLRVGQVRLQLLELVMHLVLRGRTLDWLDVLAARDGQDIQLVIEYEAVVARPERKDESLIEAGYDSVMC
jgi:hypothetical protein